MRKKGYLFVELAVVMGLFSVVIFPLVMLMNKNIKNLNFIREEYEIRKITENLETVFEKILKNSGENINFSLLKDENEKESFILLNGKGEKITKLRNIRINSDIKISVNEKKVFIKNNENEICKIFILEVVTKDKIIKKFLSVQRNEKQ